MKLNNFLYRLNEIHSILHDNDNDQISKTKLIQFIVNQKEYISDLESIDSDKIKKQLKEIYDISRNDDLNDIFQRVQKLDYLVSDTLHLIGDIEKQRESQVQTVEDDEDDDISSELVEIFIEESEEIFERISVHMDTLSKNLEDISLCTEIQQELHTLKGGARMLGQQEISEMAHEIESLYSSYAEQKKPIVKEQLDFINAGQDFLWQMIDALRQGIEIPKAKNILKKIQEAQIEFSPPDEVKLTKSIEAARNKNSSKALKVTLNDITRVRTELLESLGGLINENSIMVVQLRQHFSKIKQNILDMHLRTNKMADQMKNLTRELEDTLRESITSFTRYKKVNTLELEQYSETEYLMSAVSETFNEMLYINSNLMDSLNIVDDNVSGQLRIAGDVHNAFVRTRMVPLSSIVSRLHLLVRQTSKELKKKVDFQITHADGEMDRFLLEKAIPALEHLIRNAIDHGIEDPKERLKMAKPEEGLLRLSFIRFGPEVHIQLLDDGRGIDEDIILDKAISVGLASSDEILTPAEIFRFILEPQFTTKDKLNEMSGRGIGLSAVNTDIKQLGGSIDIGSRYGVGTKFTITLPFSISLNSALVFYCVDKKFAIQASNIDAVTKIPKTELKCYLGNKSPRFYYGNKAYKTEYLGKLLNFKDEPIHHDSIKYFPVLLIHGTNFEFALIVDKIIERREIMIKPLAKEFQNINFSSGATILEDGEIVIILETKTIADQILSSQPEEHKENIYQKRSKELHTHIHYRSSKHNVMIVDDSLTVRRATEVILNRANYNTTLAKDGVDALEKIHAARPSVILVDIEMPLMDGFEFTKNVRESEIIKEIPIIMISSRSGLKYKEEAFKLGVNGFLGKPFNTTLLLDLIERLIR